MMKLNILGFLLLLFFACKQSEIRIIELHTPKIEDFIVKFAKVRNTDLVLMRIQYVGDSTIIQLGDLYTTCGLNVGDEFGFLVGEEWTNVSAPMFKTKINAIDIYIETGLESIYKSRSRYEEFITELKGRVSLCVRSYDEKEDVFMSDGAPRSTQLWDWKMVINNDLTHMNMYTSRREGYDDAHYEIERVRIDTNYQERYD